MGHACAVLCRACPPRHPPPQRDDWQHWVYVALVVLVTACPCALVISTPVTSVCGLARAARQV
jgi:cation transport ATPase